MKNFKTPTYKFENDTLTVTATSPISMIERTKTFPVKEYQYNWWLSGVLIQDAFQHLSIEDREFILTGITAEEWDATFKDEDE
jgi:hypothetical protein